MFFELGAKIDNDTPGTWPSLIPVALLAEFKEIYRYCYNMKALCFMISMFTHFGLWPIIVRQKTNLTWN